MKKIRCAIYTRKSSEEGLEQDFNSLDAQREACAAYVLSQASEGWSALPDIYDDGGLSGGNLERPALKRLLDDIASGRIDIVVVYKVDRLTRSLLDFSKLVEAFDKAGTSFVSITQSFNTTTSMGRLTLNMLLSFAQFEREVTAERIRDKIAASKARGMWMGGNPPLGYRPDGRSLAIVEVDARVVRDIFTRYLAIGNVRLLADELEANGIRVPQRLASTGRAMGGGMFSRGQLYKLLSNPIYIGEIHHKGIAYPGKHPAIIDRVLWDKIQQQLASNQQGVQAAATVKASSLLAGLVSDEAGEPLVSTHACKGKVRYRYYVSRALQHGRVNPDSPDSAEREGLRIPAREIEAAVIARVAEALDDPIELIAATGAPLDPAGLRTATAKAAQLAAAVRGKDRATIRALISTVQVLPREMIVELSTTKLIASLGLAAPDHPPANVRLVLPVRLTRTGMAMRLIHANGKAATKRPSDQALVKLLLKAKSWWSRLADGTIDIAALAREEGVNDSWMTRVVRLNFLAPAMIDAILDGEQPARLNADSLVSAALPVNWAEQFELLSAL